MTNRSYAILGTGAIGGYYGARLQQAGCEVHFLLRSDYEWVRAQGLKIESVRGDFVLPTVQAYRNVAQMPVCDVVVVALKSTQNYVLPQLLPPLLKPTTTVLLLQNGLGAEAQLAAWVPNHAVVGGLCFICANKVGPGQIRHLDYEAIALAAYRDGHEPAGVTAPMSAIAADFTQAGVEVRLRDDLLAVRWEKLAWNIP
ncbi:MAG: 2-dehydropantoate 2-reductase, partial [Spirulinaceae cyanobacterium RM2_2_10]|nr:2-dehydropantoate 2-reductase [Spirulinaceae cyanobacterium RM2_2_10]